MLCKIVFIVVRENKQFIDQVRRARWRRDITDIVRSDTNRNANLEHLQDTSDRIMGWRGHATNLPHADGCRGTTNDTNLMFDKPIKQSLKSA